MTNGTEYVYQIRAVNGAGDGEASEAVAATPNNDVLRVTIGDSRRVVEGDEGQTEMVVAILLSGSPSHEVRVRVRAHEMGSGSNLAATGSEGDGQDFVPLTQSVVFPANASGDDLRQEVRITVLGDRLAELDEIFRLTVDNLESEDERVLLGSGIGMRDGNYAISIQVWPAIEDDDDALTITANDSHVIEGDEGQTEMVFTVQLSRSPSHEVRLKANTSQHMPFGIADYGDSFAAGSHAYSHQRSGEPMQQDFVPLSEHSGHRAHRWQRFLLFRCLSRQRERRRTEAGGTRHRAGRPSG